MSIDYVRRAEVVARPDVLVCGAGCAGVAAAVAAARMGVSTMVVEQWGFAGGNISAALVPGCCGLADMGTGELAVGGIALELMDLTGAIKLPLASKRLFDPVTSEEGRARNKQPFWWDVERFKVAADRLMLRSDVRLLYHTKVLDVATSGPKIEHVVIGNKAGITAIKPKVVIDCTGDGDVAAWSGAPYDVADVVQSMTLVFRLGGVQLTPDTDIRKLQDKCAVVLEKAWLDERIGVYAGPWIRYLWPGVLSVSATRLPFNAACAEDLTRAEVKGREDAWRVFELWKEGIPEFKEAFFITSGPSVGARESRRIRGVYTLTLEDVLTSRRFPDAVVRGAWYADQHPVDEPGYHKHILVAPYDIPYRTLLPQGIENLLVAGRCHSVTSEALASSRVGITAMGMGQAAGVAAALAVQTESPPHAIDVQGLRRNLLDQGAILGGRRCSGDGSGGRGEPVQPVSELAS